MASTIVVRVIQDWVTTLDGLDAGSLRCEADDITVFGPFDDGDAAESWVAAEPLKFNGNPAVYMIQELEPVVDVRKAVEHEIWASIMHEAGDSIID